MRTCIFDTITGALQLTVEPSAASWSAKIDGSGQGQATFPLREQGIAPTLARSLFRKDDRIVAHVDDDDTVVAAGVIGRSVYDRDSGKVTSTWNDIRTLVAARLGFEVSGWDTSGTLTVSNKTRTGTIRAALVRAMRGGGDRALPIELPDDSAGLVNRTWPYYGFATMDDVIREIEDEGVELWFDPWLVDGRISFRARVGGGVSFAQFDVPVTVPESPIRGLQVTTDSAKRVSGVLAGGNGQEADRVTAYATATSAGPARDVFVSTDAKKKADVQDFADAYIAANKDPVEQWSYSVQLGNGLTHILAKCGRVFNMDVRDDEWIPDGLYRRRVISVSGDLTPTVKVEVQPYGS